ncbi:DNA replication and repair protein RecN [Halothece sp. PCC 7418]|uniref:DNA repair protein RecN n=1 Tax=Halothece sp. (strain PCC 7418) TaxID=65093 RepID=UPI0002A07342|nr:DNA repair protein RecN [Halothece sp. PCC 7418]AFZ43920.1 DNA replication and repair protein RecN [Halothece sp. PCC 7418]
MLISLRIENFALVDELELDLGTGLNVLTGETGAGKSIILDAIDAALGGKVNSRFMRTGSEKALVEATFSLTPAIQSWLEAQEIDLLDDQTLVCSREMSQKGNGLRSRSRVNGVLVNRQLINELRSYLVEITAQGQTVALMIPARQRELLDTYGGQSLLAQRKAVAKAYETYSQCKDALETRRQTEQERLQRLDWIQHQLEELHSAQLDQESELEDLEQERDRLLHAVELQQLSYQVYQTLYQRDDEAPAGTDILGDAENLLTEMVQYDSQLAPLLEMVQNAMTQIVEAGQQIYAYGEGLESDPDRLSEVEDRIRTLKQICRKYGPDLKDAIAHQKDLETELNRLNDSEQSLETLEENTNAAYETLIQACSILSEQRKDAAVRLEEQLVAELKPLAMEKVQFYCTLTEIAPSAQGTESVNYYFSPNPGETPKPLSETASGGEMSRFLLALKACFSQAEQKLQTLVFDEIDTGVSGRVASAIGQKLRQLAQNQQILCVTHQPLVAALADFHFRVEKQFSTSRTTVSVMRLSDPDTRRDELAQLAGGDNDENAIAFADSLLKQAQL